jgi:hypothetical protein
MKILSIAYNPYNNNNNNSKTMRSFFDGIPSKELSMFYMESYSEVDYDFCDAYYRVTDQDVLRSILNLSFRTRNTHPKVKYQRVVESKVIESTRKNKTPFSRIIRELLWKFNTWNTKDLNDWIAEQKPDIIFTLFGNNLFVHDIVVKVSRKHNIPFVAYYTDDYVLNCFNNSLFGRLHWLMSKKTYKKSMILAEKCYVIGEKMKEDYTKAFSREFGILGNSINFENFNDFNIRQIDLGKKIVISFIGGLHLNRWRTICELGELMKEVNIEKSWNIEINVYALKLDEEIEYKLEQCGVNYKGALTPQGVIDTMRKSDILLHIESFDKINRTFVKYSVSTKISEYFASKRLVLAFGPHEVASIALIKDNNLGCVLTDLDNWQEKKEKLIKAIENYNTSDFSAQYEYCKQYYDRDKTREMLLSDMMKIIKNK